MVLHCNTRSPSKEILLGFSPPQLVSLVLDFKAEHLPADPRFSIVTLGHLPRKFFLAFLHLLLGVPLLVTIKVVLGHHLWQTLLPFFLFLFRHLFSCRSESSNKSL